MYPQATLKLARSVSDQNICLTYVCLVNEIKLNDHGTRQSHKLINHLDPDVTEGYNDDDHIRVERSKALHELVESHRKSDEDVKVDTREIVSTSTYLTTSGEEIQRSESEDAIAGNPNLLKLTKMKWLTEERGEAPDSSSPSLSPTSSRSSVCSRESSSKLVEGMSLNDKYLSTILRLDKEHNMFGLSNITIVGSKTSRKPPKEDDKAVFHQTAIVQICCGKRCCRNKSNTDLPSSLKCGGCRGCCLDPVCRSCIGPCEPPCDDPGPCPPLCVSCPKGKCSCKLLCPPSKCTVDCSTCFGMKIAVNRKPKYEPAPVELTPRSSCVLQKPLAARSCHHLPHCIPPSSCFPYLMPCFWPARPAAPCSNPARCFHNPPCQAPRRRKPIGPPPEDACPTTGKCADDAKKSGKCGNQNCPGNNPAMKKELQSRFGKH